MEEKAFNVQYIFRVLQTDCLHSFQSERNDVEENQACMENKRDINRRQGGKGGCLDMFFLL